MAYLVERNVVLYVFRFLFGVGVVPGDVSDGVPVDGGVIVGCGAGRPMSQVSLSDRGKI